MKTFTRILSVGVGALCMSCALHAQNAPPANGTSTQPAPPTSTDPRDQSKGQDVSGNPQPPTSQTTKTPPTAGQNNATGNNLVGGNTGQMANAGHPDFKTLDVKNKGYVTADDVKSQPAVKANFSKCDADHDGHLTAAEYSNCSKN